jgi:hypothetical protein
MLKPDKHITLTIALIIAILLGCKHKNLQAAQMPAIHTPAASNAPGMVVPASTDTVGLAQGTYSCNCLTDTAKQIKLTLSMSNSVHIAALVYNAHSVSGELHRDTVNYDKAFNIWSFKNAGKVYGFRFSKNDDNTIAVALINEDYKKEFKSCSDAREIDFIKH